MGWLLCGVVSPVAERSRSHVLLRFKCGGEVGGEEGEVGHNASV